MKRLLVFTGAGVSKNSGIPTFVELGDLRDKLSRSFFNQKPEVLYEVLLSFKNKIDEALPNDAHLAIAEHELRVITMNIDGLHQKAGSKKVLEIHGNLNEVKCPSCEIVYPFKNVARSIKCDTCGSILEPEVVLYEDGLNQLYEAFMWVDKSDHLLVIGTSFYTSTASFIVNRAKAKGVGITIINEDAKSKVPSFIDKWFE